ncbi:3-oxoacyl-[acyl-carrier-protein] reductase [bacterium]|nr:MAG: 3-oxoacyl-[acyl-carrier-protein] reductase [bacterium]
MHLTDKVAIITGSGRGNGAAIAKKLASHGAKIALVDINENDLSARHDEIVSSNGIAEYFKCDVSNWNDVKQTTDSIVEKFGRIDILINNAGITRDNLIMRMPPDDWDIVLAVNLKGAFLFTKAIVRPMMKNRYGKIVNISSVVGIFGNAAQANYSASKAGIIGLTKSTAKELASRGIRCNAVAPGFIETEMTKNLPEKAVDEFLQATPLKYPGKPDDVAELVMFLCSPESDYITGEIIRVDGGMAI